MFNHAEIRRKCFERGKRIFYRIQRKIHIFCKNLKKINENEIIIQIDSDMTFIAQI